MALVFCALPSSLLSRLSRLKLLLIKKKKLKEPDKYSVTLSSKTSAIVKKKNYLLINCVCFQDQTPAANYANVCTAIEILTYLLSVLVSKMFSMFVNADEVKWER